MTARSVFKICASFFASAAASGVLATDLCTQLNASRTTPGAVLPYTFAGQAEGTFYLTRLDDPFPNARGALPGM